MTPSASGIPTEGGSSDGGRASITQGQNLVVDVPSIVTIAGTIASQTALLGGLLYYFGWVHAKATLAYFGLDTSLMEYGFPDYLLRSIGVAFLPFIKAALAALVLLGIHRFVVQPTLEMPAESRARRVGQQLVTVTHMIALALTTLVIIRILFPGQLGWPSGITLPLLIVASVALLGYTLHLHSRYLNPLARKRSSHTQQQALVLLTLGLLGMFWAVGLHAEEVGKRTAADIVAGLPARPSVVLYSAERIAVTGTGVEVAEIAQPDSKYRYQYNGIRLLGRSTEKYLVLPVDWKQGHDRVFVIPDDGSIRIDIAVRIPIEPVSSSQP
ncbi:MAG: hypothetical protein ACRDTC_05670 [Pseudonocardiaceae bacterium]